jgi:hypothetical protein
MPCKRAPEDYVPSGTFAEHLAKNIIWLVDDAYTLISAELHNYPDPSGNEQYIGGSGSFDPGYGLQGAGAVVLSTGTANDAYIESNEGGTQTTAHGTTTQDPLLATLESATQWDLARLKFSVVFDYSGTLQWTYIFASEEYKEFVGTEYRDLFGMFYRVNGGTWTNIAVLPGNLPVNIDNVNDTTNSSLYVDNDYDDVYGLPSTYPEIYFDGFTVPLQTLEVPIVAGQQYDFVLAIADVADDGVDSAVLIEFGSNRSGVFLDCNSTVNIDAHLVDGPPTAFFDIDAHIIRGLFQEIDAVLLEEDQFQIYYVNKDQNNFCQFAQYITGLQDLEAQNWKHIKSIDMIGNYGDNSISLAWTKTPDYSVWSSYYERTPTDPGTDQATRFYNLGHARRFAFDVVFQGNSNIEHNAIEVEFNIKTD